MTDFASPFNSPDPEPISDIRDLIGIHVPTISRREQVASAIRSALQEELAEEILDILRDPEFRPLIIDTFKMTISPSAKMLEERLEPLDEGEQWKRGEDSEEAASERMDSKIDELYESPEILQS